MLGTFFCVQCDEQLDEQNHCSNEDCSLFTMYETEKSRPDYKVEVLKPFCEHPEFEKFVGFRSYRESGFLASILPVQNISKDDRNGNWIIPKIEFQLFISQMLEFLSTCSDDGVQVMTEKLVFDYLNGVNTDFTGYDIEHLVD